MLNYCKYKKKNKLFDCDLDYFWYQDKKWQKVCETPRTRWFFPPRYYKIKLQCKIRNIPIKGLEAEWLVFY